MKRLCIIFCLVLTGTAEAERGYLWNGSPYEGELDNSLPREIVVLDFPGGAGLVPKDLQGVSWIVTKVFREGPGSMTGDAYRKELFLLNSSISFQVDSRYARVVIVAPKESFAKAMALAKAVLQGPKLDVKTFQENKQRVLVQRRAMDDNMRQLIAYYWLRDTFAYHPEVLDGTGSPWSINRVTLDHVKEYATKLFQWQHAFVTFIGPVPPKIVVKTVNGLFFNEQTKQDYTPYAYPEIEIDDVHVKGLKVTLIDKPGATDNQIRFVHLLPKKIRRDSKEYFHLWIMHRILGQGGFDSRLLSTLRTKRGLTYSINSFFFSVLPVWGVATFAVTDQTGKLLQGIDEVVDAFKKERIRKQEIAEVKEKLTSSYKASMELAKDRLFDRIDYRHYNLNERFMSRFLKHLQRVKAKDVMRMAQSTLRRQHGRLYLMGDKEKLLPIVAEYGVEPKAVRIVNIADIQ